MLLVDPVVDLAVERHEQLAVGLARDERAGLRAEVGAGDEDRGHLVADHLVDLRQVRQADLALPLEDLLDVVAARGGAHVPLGDVADAARMLEPGRRHQGDVAEGRAAEIGQDGLVGAGAAAARPHSAK